MATLKHHLNGETHAFIHHIVSSQYTTTFWGQTDLSLFKIPTLTKLGDIGHVTQMLQAFVYSFSKWGYWWQLSYGCYGIY